MVCEIDAAVVQIRVRLALQPREVAIKRLSSCDSRHVSYGWLIRVIVEWMEACGTAAALECHERLHRAPMTSSAGDGGHILGDHGRTRFGSGSALPLAVDDDTIATAAVEGHSLIYTGFFFRHRQ